MLVIDPFFIHKHGSLSHEVKLIRRNISSTFKFHHLTRLFKSIQVKVCHIPSLIFFLRVVLILRCRKPLISVFAGRSVFNSSGYPLFICYHDDWIVLLRSSPLQSGSILVFLCHAARYVHHRCHLWCLLFFFAAVVCHIPTELKRFNLILYFNLIWNCIIILRDPWYMD